ncbi:MAG: hypothetical protein ACRC62_15695 [Microcoleus sp.]
MQTKIHLLAGDRIACGKSGDASTDPSAVTCGRCLSSQAMAKEHPSHYYKKVGRQSTGIKAWLPLSPLALEWVEANGVGAIARLVEQQVNK